MRLANGRDAIYNVAGAGGGCRRGVRRPGGRRAEQPRARCNGSTSLGGHATVQPDRAAPEPAPRTSPPGGPQPCLKASEVAPGQGAYTADQIATAYGFSGVYQYRRPRPGRDDRRVRARAELAQRHRRIPEVLRHPRKVSYVKVDGGVGNGHRAGRGGARHRAADRARAEGEPDRLPGAEQQLRQPRHRALRHARRDDQPGQGAGHVELVGRVRVARGLRRTLTPRARCSRRPPRRARHSCRRPATRARRTAAARRPAATPTTRWRSTIPAASRSRLAVGGTSLTAIRPAADSRRCGMTTTPSIDYARFGIQQGAGRWRTLVAVDDAELPVERPVSALGVINTDSSGDALRRARRQLLPRGARRLRRRRPDVTSTSITGTATTAPRARGVRLAGHGRHQRRRAGMGGAVRACRREPRVPGDADRLRQLRALRARRASPSRPTSTTSPWATTTSRPSGNTSGLYAAGPGYDMASGLGTPKAAALVPALCEQAVHVAYPGAVHTFYDQHVRLRCTPRLPPARPGTLTFHATQAAGRPAPERGHRRDQRTRDARRRPHRHGHRVELGPGPTARSSSTGRSSGGRRLQPRWPARSLQPALTITVPSPAHSSPACASSRSRCRGSITLAGGARAVKVLSTSGRTLVHRPTSRATC